MTSIHITVRGHCATALTDGLIVAGTVGLPVTFDFDAEWDGLTKTAVFKAGGIVRDRVDIGAETTIPHEVLSNPGPPLAIGVQGVNADGTIVIPTIWAVAGLIVPGADPSGDPGMDPTPPVWQDLQQQIGTLDDLETPIKDDLVKAINSVAKSGSAATGAVKYDAAQDLTTEQQETARSNIGAQEIICYDSRREITYTFDGSLEGKEHIDTGDGGYWVKVSDDVPEDILTIATVTRVCTQDGEEQTLVQTRDSLEFYPNDEPIIGADYTVFVLQDFTVDGVAFTKGVWFLYHPDYMVTHALTINVGKLHQIPAKYIPLPAIEELLNGTLVATGKTEFSTNAPAVISPAQDTPRLKAGKCYDVYVDGVLQYTATCDYGKLWGWESADEELVLVDPRGSGKQKIAESISNNELFAVTDSGLPWSEQGLALEIYEVEQIPEKHLKNAVTSVNGKKGEVNLTASDVGALPDTTEIPTVPSDVSAFENDAGYLTSHQSLEGYAKKSDIPAVPDTLPNPNALTFTGAVEGSYDGSKAVTINIPEGGGSSGGSGGTDIALGMTGATVGQIAKITAVDENGIPTAWEPVDMSGNWTVLSETFTHTGEQTGTFKLTPALAVLGDWNEAYLITKIKTATTKYSSVRVNLNAIRDNALNTGYDINTTATTIIVHLERLSDTTFAVLQRRKDGTTFFQYTGLTGNDAFMLNIHWNTIPEGDEITAEGQVLCR